MQELVFYRVTADNKTIKELARQSLKGKWVKGYIALLIAFITINVPSYLAGLLINTDSASYFSFAYELLAMAFFFPGIARFFLNLTRGTSDSFSALLKSADCTGKTIVMFLFFLAIAVVCSGYILLVVAGFAMLLRYIMAYNVLVEDDKKRVLRCFTESSLMMRGNKVRMFKLLFSFAGWGVAAFTVVYLVIFFKAYPAMTPYLGEVTDMNSINNISPEAYTAFYNALSSVTPLILASFLPMLLLLEYIIAAVDVFYDIEIGYLSFADPSGNIDDAFAPPSPKYNNEYREMNISVIDNVSYTVNEEIPENTTETEEDKND